MFILKKAEHSAEAFGEARPTTIVKKQTIYSSASDNGLVWGVIYKK